MAANTPAASYKFNSMQEIKSHSSILYNERMAILFYQIDILSIKLNTTYSVDLMMQVLATIKQIYKNIRMLIRNNPIMRATLNLDTKDPGIYVTDVAMGTIDRMIEYCQAYGFTTKRVYIIVQELNHIETMIKDSLQYFHYFIRPDFRQKPDISNATDKYKEIADERTVDELRAIVGKNHLVDFDSLGSTRIGLNENNEEEDDDENDDEDKSKEEDDT